MSDVAVKVVADLLAAVQSGDDRAVDDLLLDHRAELHECAKVLAELTLAHVAASGADPAMYVLAMSAGVAAMTGGTR